MTKRVKIVMLGNPLPLAENPIRLAEELAMIDMISKGRLVSGFVRGGGQEQLATGVNPAFNRERFEEAHDLIVKTWTQPGPVPLGGHPLPAPGGQPLGGAAPAAAPAHLDSRRPQHGDDHLGGRAPLPLHRAEHVDRGRRSGSGRPTTTAAEEVGYTRGPENRGYLQRVPRGRDRREGDRECPPVHVDAGRVHRPGAPGLEQPVGLLLARAPARLRRVRGRARRSARAAGRRFEEQIDNMQIIAGTPKTVIAEAAAHPGSRPGRASWRSGAATAASATRTPRPASACWARRCCRRCARSAKELGLNSPFEAETPVSLQFSTDLRKPAVAAEWPAGCATPPPPHRGCSCRAGSAAPAPPACRRPRGSRSPGSAGNPPAAARPGCRRSAMVGGRAFGMVA